MESISFKVVLVIFLLAVTSDIFREKIPNALSVVGLLMGLVFQSYSSGISGMLSGLGGALCALFIFGTLFRFRWVGGGDVKLMMAVCSFYDPVQALMISALGIAFGAVTSPLIATLRMGWQPLLVTLKRYRMMAAFRTYIAPESSEIAGVRVPYAPALALGWLFYVLQIG
ncbi:prepilin peptidase [Marinobacter sp. F4216]|uniref:A24 family peptidase n=1 Tax=Marinobacter sp. F4216 TaxID=2874281 RepID=UPI001CBF7480|nr:prepilin peptidase [Marinobacter sp. F4216]MBZ2168925.1 prepilin peptidase [Marinobacter sp. F4216]